MYLSLWSVNQIKIWALLNESPNPRLHILWNGCFLHVYLECIIWATCHLSSPISSTKAFKGKGSLNWLTTNIELFSCWSVWILQWINIKVPNSIHLFCEHWENKLLKKIGRHAALNLKLQILLVWTYDILLKTRLCTKLLLLSSLKIVTALYF